MDTLTGSGLIRAAGGMGSSYSWQSYAVYGGGGGGGRVAVYARDWSGFSLTNITAPGGLSPGASGGGAGTVYLKASSDSLGTLIVDAGSGGRNLTPLGVAGMTSMVGNAAMVVRGGGVVGAQHSGMHVTIAGSLEVLSSGYLQLDSGLTLLGPLTVSGGGVMRAAGLLQGLAAVQVREGGTLLADRIEVPALSLVNTGLVSSLSATASQVHRLTLVVSNDLVVDVSSRIDVSGKGYLPGVTLGNSTTNASSCNSGGSYGGVGGSGYVYGGCSGRAGVVYGDFADPDDWGSGAAEGAAGGGLVRLRVGQLRLDGLLLADGVASANMRNRLGVCC